MDLREFIRQFEKRHGQTDWFFGAGASAASGVPTATDLIWKYKSEIYCSDNGISRSQIHDLSDPAFQEIIDSYVQTRYVIPPSGHPEEYSAVVESAYPDPVTRKSALDEVLSGAKPSRGHVELSRLIEDGFVSRMWTTNFDRLIEQSVSDQTGSIDSLISAGYSNPVAIEDAITIGNHPFLAKLHGDFLYDRLKNTTDELQTQDARTRQAFVTSNLSRDLAVVGYSGRDKSVMDMISDGCSADTIYWFAQHGQLKSPEIQRLSSAIVDSGGTFNWIEISSFDELIIRIGDYVGTSINRPGSQRILVDWKRPPATARPPLLRTNLIKISKSPVQCALIRSNIGGNREVRAAVESSGARCRAVRTREGVLAFGAEDELRKAFGKSIKIGTSRLGYGHLNNTSIMALVSDSLVAAISELNAIRVSRRRNSWVVTPTGESIKEIASGIVPNSGERWREVCRLSISAIDDQLILSLEPYIDFNIPRDQPIPDAAKALRNERSNTRYNHLWYEWLDKWKKLLFGDSSVINVAEFAGSEHPAQFEIITRNMFSGSSM